MNGALLVNKDEGISSFGVIERLSRDLMERKNLRKRDLPKIGHGGTLDPFATGLLVVCVGGAVKVARYFLGSGKTYEGLIRFGQTTVPGDPTSPVSERSDHLPGSLEEIRAQARLLTLQPYLQTPPMHSAKKLNGKPLYELARQGIEVDREPKTCHLHEFEILDYENACSRFRLSCSSGTYVRTLAQDLGRLLGTVAMLDSLNRTGSGIFDFSRAMTIAQINEAAASGQAWDDLPAWIPFHRLLDGFDRAQATADEAQALLQGRQGALFNILKRVEPSPISVGDESAKNDQPRSQIAIFSRESLIAVAGKTDGQWGLERVFTGG